ncbi:hypothetical protein HIM_01879 [Hirsutella minnesotensis 3608]|nr:hypothetical protein HIM_01879 [Hirsutella minnesotensis 3608]
MAVQGQKGLFVPIQVFSDPLCPWCWVGKHSLEAALSRYRTKHHDVEFEVVWRPFCLNPALKSNCDKASFYAEWSACAGDSNGDNTQDRFEQVRAAGAKYGLSFSFSGSMGPSTPAQALVASALRRRGSLAQARVVEALFRGHFCDGQNIGDKEWLVRVGRDAAGTPADVVRADLRDDDWIRLVDDGAELAVEEHGVEAIPCVIVSGRYKIGGFQEEDVFLSLFDRIREEQLLGSCSRDAPAPQSLLRRDVEALTVREK